MIQQPYPFIFGVTGHINDTIPKYNHEVLYATLLELKPKICVEIGTHQGGSANVFQKYFNEHRQDGLLITCDVMNWVSPRNIEDVIAAQMPNCHYLKVYPHWADTYMCEAPNTLPNWQNMIHSSIDNNFNLIQGMLKTYGYDKADFVFIDADHRAICLSKDIILADRLTQNNWVLIEDVDPLGTQHESHGYYQNVFKYYNIYDCYDFDNWNVHTNCALIKRRI